MSLVLKVNTKNNKIEESIESMSSRFCKELEKFWGVKLKYEPIIFLLKSREEINTIRRQETDDKLVGWFWNKRFIFILAPDKFKKESAFLKEDFEVILKHELSHFFFYMITQGNVPAWIDEGLACHLAGQKYKENINEAEITKLMECFYSFDRQLFAISSQTVQKLIKLKGKNIFVNFVKNFDRHINEKSFKKLFKQSFDIDFNKSGIYKLLK